MSVMYIAREKKSGKYLAANEKSGFSSDKNDATKWTTIYLAEHQISEWPEFKTCEFEFEKCC